MPETPNKKVDRIAKNYAAQALSPDLYCLLQRFEQQEHTLPVKTGLSSTRIAD